MVTRVLLLSGWVLLCTGVITAGLERVRGLPMWGRSLAGSLVLLLLSLAAMPSSILQVSRAELGWRQVGRETTIAVVLFSVAILPATGLPAIGLTGASLTILFAACVEELVFRVALPQSFARTLTNGAYL